MVLNTKYNDKKNEILSKSELRMIRNLLHYYALLSEPRKNFKRQAVYLLIAKGFWM